MPVCYGEDSSGPRLSDDLALAIGKLSEQRGRVLALAERHDAILRVNDSLKQQALLLDERLTVLRQEAQTLRSQVRLLEQKSQRREDQINALEQIVQRQDDRMHALEQLKNVSESQAMEFKQQLDVMRSVDFRASRAYRLWRYYLSLYDKPGWNVLLRLARRLARAVARFRRAWLRNRKSGS